MAAFLVWISNGSLSSSSSGNGVPSNSFPRGADVIPIACALVVLSSTLIYFDSRFSLGSIFEVSFTTGVAASKLFASFDSTCPTSSSFLFSIGCDSSN